MFFRWGGKNGRENQTLMGLLGGGWKEFETPPAAERGWIYLPSRDVGIVSLNGYSISWIY